MKKIFVVLFSLVFAATAFAQKYAMTDYVPIAQMENNGVQIEVFAMNNQGVNDYFLCVGSLGIGDDVVQLNIDPVSKLFIPLGNTIDGAIEKMADLQGLFKEQEGFSTTVDGILAPIMPNGEVEPVTVIYKKVILTRNLEFVVTRNGYVRSTYIPRSSINSIASSLKFHKKLHPSAN